MKAIFNEIEESVLKPESTVVNECFAIHYRGSILTRQRLVEILKAEGRWNLRVPRKIYYRKGTAKAALTYLPDAIKAECSVVRYIPEKI